jgi:hypothetical protein
MLYRLLTLAPLALALTACGGKSDSAPAAAAASTSSQATTTPADPASTALAQVTSAESGVQAAGCFVEVRNDAAARGPRDGVRVDCDRVPDRFGDLRYARYNLVSYRQSIRAALDQNLDDADRFLLSEKAVAVNRALEQIGQRIEALRPRP